MKRSSLARSAQPMKRTSLRTRKPRSKETTPEAWQSKWGRCSLCLTVGLVDQHHILPARYLRRRGLHPYLWDVRNRLADVGRDCCHTPHENAVRRIPREFVPHDAEVFANELGLKHVLDRFYGKRAA